MGSTGIPAHDPLLALREYRKLAPWRLRDLATLAGAILDASGIKPVNAAAAITPSERTIRFYVARKIVNPPEGRGTSATYSYRHLLQVLSVKLRQMEGAALDTIRQALTDTTGDVLERHVAATLGRSLPSPSQLTLLRADATPRGRAGQLLHLQLADRDPERPHASEWTRIEVTDGVEIHVRTDHPLVRTGISPRDAADAIRVTVQRLIGSASPPAPEH